ncbi:MAG: DNA translocase FtsK [Spirochaetales bacterium]|nr:DNA translocase FtsK [Spirochaetales bacterium]
MRLVLPGGGKKHDEVQGESPFSESVFSSSQPEAVKIFRGSEDTSEEEDHAGIWNREQHIDPESGAPLEVFSRVPSGETERDTPPGSSTESGDLSTLLKEGFAPVLNSSSWQEPEVLSSLDGVDEEAMGFFESVSDSEPEPEPVVNSVRESYFAPEPAVSRESATEREDDVLEVEELDESPAWDGDLQDSEDPFVRDLIEEAGFEEDELSAEVSIKENHFYEAPQDDETPDDLSSIAESGYEEPFDTEEELEDGEYQELDLDLESDLERDIEEGFDTDPEDPFELIDEMKPEPEVIPEPNVPIVPSGPKLPPKQPLPKKPKVKYKVPEDLLTVYADGQYWIVDDETRAAADVLKRTLEEFKIAAEVTGISKGPVITMFELLPAPGVKLSKIVNLADNIALGLAASSVRIVAPIPGKHAVGIEVPNKQRAIVSFKEMLESENRETKKMQVPVILGKDITGGTRVIDLVQTPHLLIAGATGSGKSVSVNALICSILYRRKPDEVKLILIDPKIVELKLYNGIPHLLTPVITDPKRAFKALQYAIYEMERRYSLLDNLGVREIKSYNNRVKEQKLATDPLPYIVIVVDEFADLMATSGKELEGVIARLTAMSRAVGIHLVLATQRPSVDVITGLIKANIPSRIAFMVAGKFDSRIILDEVGAEKLLGKGDMLFTSAWDPNPVRMQGAYLSEEEAERVADHVKSLGEPDYIDDEIFMDEDEGDDFQLTPDSGQDPLFETAVSIVIEAGKASASYLQRRLKVGYNRAARLVEEMEMRGIVGSANGSKPREILHIPDRPPSGVSGRGVDTGTSVSINGLGQAGPRLAGDEPSSDPDEE